MELSQAYGAAESMTNIAFDDLSIFVMVVTVIIGTILWWDSNET